MTIDIMMPFYGDFEHFKLAVESVQEQTDGDWRLVVVDDRYPDRAAGRWIETLGDSRVDYHLNDKNLGVSRNFSRCLELVRSSHFVLMGCDDLLEPDYVRTVADYIDRFPEASYFQPDVTVVDATGNAVLPLGDRVKRRFRPQVTTPTPLEGESLAASLLRGNWTYFPSICWRTDVVRSHGFRADLGVVLDLQLQFEIVLDGGTMVLLPEHLFRYRRHEASVSSWTARDGSRFDEERRFFLAAAALLEHRGWQHARKVALRHMSSRLNAATKVTGAIAARDPVGVAELIRHVLTGWTTGDRRRNRP